jgi:hypothetical protein
LYYNFIFGKPEVFLTGENVMSLKSMGEVLARALALSKTKAPQQETPTPPHLQVDRDAMRVLSDPSYEHLRRTSNPKSVPVVRTMPAPDLRVDRAVPRGYSNGRDTRVLRRKGSHLRLIK